MCPAPSGAVRSLCPGRMGNGGARLMRPHRETEDRYGTECRNRRVVGAVKRVHGRRSPRGMTSPPPLAARAESLSAEAPHDDWVLPISIEQPGRVLAESTRWAERGPIRCFFHGLLFDRELLAA